MTSALLPALASCAADPILQKAVKACLKESPSGSCDCRNGCGADDADEARFSGPLDAWDTSEITSMSELFYNPEEEGCFFCEFNGNLSAWDTSRVTDMNRM